MSVGHALFSLRAQTAKVWYTRQSALQVVISKEIYMKDVDINHEDCDCLLCEMKGAIKHSQTLVVETQNFPSSV